MWIGARAEGHVTLVPEVPFAVWIEVRAKSVDAWYRTRFGDVGRLGSSQGVYVKTDHDTEQFLRHYEDVYAVPS